MVLTAAEKMQRYRERLKREDPQKYEEQRKKNLARIKSKKKKISEMTVEQAEAKRKEWREEKKISRNRNRVGNRPPLGAQISENRFKNAENSDKAHDKKLIRLQKRIKSAWKQLRLYKSEIGFLQTKLQCYKKRLHRVKMQTKKSLASLEQTIEKVKARNEVLESTLKKSYASCKNASDKRILKKTVLNSTNKRYASQLFGLKVTYRLKQKKINGGKGVGERKGTIPEIAAFYLRNDVSRMTSGKKECRVKNKQKQQIRYLVDSIPYLHTKYKAEGGKYGLITFYKQKPFFVLSPHIKSRASCLCEKHENIKFKYEALKKFKIINDGFDQLLQKIVCDVKNFACMYNLCTECKNKTPVYQVDQDTCQETINWYNWERQAHTYTKKEGNTIHTKKTVRALKTDTIQKLMDDFSRDIITYKKHHYNNFHQQSEYQRAITRMKPTEAVVVCDFSENFECKLPEEIQSMHFGASRSQISLHTGMIYFKNGSQSFCTFSDNLCHQPAAIWAHLTPIMATIKEKCPEVDVLHFFSDGPTSQYRQKHNFYLHSLYTMELGLSYSTWSYFEAGHGKSVADGIGGTIKRMLDFKVCHGTEIKDARDAYEAINKTKTAIQVHLIEDVTINDISKRIPGNVLVLSGTMKIHQITARDGVKIKYRDVSCFCEPLRGCCDCYSPKQHNLQSPVSKSDISQPTTVEEQIDFDILDQDVSSVNLEDIALDQLMDIEFPLPDIAMTIKALEVDPTMKNLDSGETTEATPRFDGLQKEELQVHQERSTNIPNENLDISTMPFAILTKTESISPITKICEEKKKENELVSGESHKTSSENISVDKNNKEIITSEDNNENSQESFNVINSSPSNQKMPLRILLENKSTLSPTSNENKTNNSLKRKKPLKSYPLRKSTRNTAKKFNKHENKPESGFNDTTSSNTLSEPISFSSAKITGDNKRNLLNSSQQITAKSQEINAVYKGLFTRSRSSKKECDKGPLSISPEIKPTTSSFKHTEIARKDKNKPQKTNPPNKVIKRTAVKLNKSDIQFAKCNKCTCSILGQKIKCMACKRLYCGDCVELSYTSDYLCETCLLGSDED